VIAAMYAHVTPRKERERLAESLKGASTLGSPASGGAVPPADGADAPLTAPPPLEPPGPHDPLCPPVAFAPVAYVVEARVWASQVHSHEPGERRARERGGSATLGPVNRSTTPSRSIRQTIASTARGRQ
jgi:hypothetical protein